jgi:hypothetical protein
VRLPRATKLPAVEGLPRVIDAGLDAPDEMSLVLQSLVGKPSIRRSRQISPGIKQFLVICLIGSPLAFIFMFASAQRQIDFGSIGRALPVDVQAFLPTAQREAPPSRIEPGPIPTPTAETGEIQVLPFQAGPLHNDGSVRSEAAATTGSTTLPSNDVVMPDLSSGGKLREIQTGVWTYCAVDLIPSGQIAVQKAMTYQACISVGKKCAGPRRFADILFFDRPTLTSKVPLELCYKDS